MGGEPQAEGVKQEPKLWKQWKTQDANVKRRWKTRRWGAAEKIHLLTNWKSHVCDTKNRRSDYLFMKIFNTRETNRARSDRSLGRTWRVGGTDSFSCE